ncbi:hypothetical protein GE061_008229 [Apolygus lucorum]|uniref:Uncharacterized protein n=1 Tax=Apolygus lucorum TaxID=248454 RepID=A0A6A4IU78_APOLU|nr:hypothetical protein GE061_008229 [Apolygus lucorum]
MDPNQLQQLISALERLIPQPQGERGQGDIQTARPSNTVYNIPPFEPFELDEGRKMKRHINQLLKSEVIRKKSVTFSDSPQLPVQYQMGEEDEGAILPAVPVASANPPQATPPQVEDFQGPSQTAMASPLRTANEESISSQPLRRSSRMRMKPRYLDDYVT